MVPQDLPDLPVGDHVGEAVGANQQQVIRLKLCRKSVDLDLNFQSDRPGEDMRNACSSCLLFSVQTPVDEILNHTVILREFAQPVLPEAVES